MASTDKTPNLNLPQWVASEKPERTDFNDAFSAIDTLLAQNTSGRFVLPNGLKIAWGKKVLDYANINVAQSAIAFPFIFSVAPVVVIAGQTTSNNAAGEIAINHKIRNVTTSGFVGIAHSPSGYFTSGNIPSYAIDWLAIGY